MAVRLPMSCRLFEAALDAYFDGELDADSARCIREHLDECACCRGRLAERRALADLVRAAPFYSAPCDLWARVLAQTHFDRAAFVALSPSDSVDVQRDDGRRLRNRVSKWGVSRQLGSA